MTGYYDGLTSRVFSEAADYIEEHGWYQGDMYPGRATSVQPRSSFADVAVHLRREHPPACLLGAVLCAAGPDMASPASGIAHNKVFAATGHGPAHYNDMVAQSAEEVVALLREIAAEGD